MRSFRSQLVMAGALAALTVLASWGCRRPGDSGAGTRPAPGNGSSGKGLAAGAGRSARSGRHAVRSLTAEAARAELWQEGLLVDLGAPDQHKFVQGGYRTQWGEPGRDGDVTYAPVQADSILRFHDWTGGIRRIVVRARARREGVGLVPRMEGRFVAAQPLGTDWRVLTFDLASPSRPGRRAVRLNVEGHHGEDAAQVDWVWFSTAAKPGAAPRPAKTGVIALSEPRRGLLAAPARTLTYYLRLPSASRLVFDYGADRPTRFAVRVTTDDRRSRTVFRATSRGRGWSEAQVDLSAFAGRHVRLELVTAGTATVAGWGEPELMADGPAPDARRRAAGPPRRARNVIQIVVDAARRDVHRRFDPASRVDVAGVDWLADKGVRFLRAYCPSNQTFPSVSTMLTGRMFTKYLPVEDLERSRVPDSQPLLPEHLRRHGLATAAFSNNPFVSAPFGLKRGWDVHRNYPLMRVQDADTKRVFGDALAWIKARARAEERYYAYLHTMDPHHPYNNHDDMTLRYFPGERPPDRLREGFTDDLADVQRSGKHPYDAREQRFIKALYHGENTYHGELLLGFFEELARNDLLNETMIILSNDHGEELFDHGSLGHGHTLHGELVNAMLVLYFPPLFPAGTASRTPVSLMDLTPTIVEVLGLAPMTAVHGESLVGALGAPEAGPMDYVYMASEEHAVVSGSYKLYLTNTGRSLLFDLAADPAEQRNRRDALPVTRRALETLLFEAIAVPDRHRRLTAAKADYAPLRGIKARLNDEAVKTLESLGYIN